MLAKQLQSEIISADSRQIYKLLDIGTAKPTKNELKNIKHYFIDELYPNEDFNVSIFEKRSNIIIQDLIDRKKIPIVVGGSGLYIKTLIDGISDAIDTDSNIRGELLELRRKYGNEYLYDELKKHDAVSANRMFPQNWKRVIRALEVIKITGKPIWQHHNETKKNNDFDFYQVGLFWERDLLYQNIEKRVDEMLELGLVEEVENILSKGYSKKLNSLNTVGYKEIIQYINSEISFERAVELIKRNTRRYAKRQMTWFNADKRIKWHKIKSQNDLELLSKDIAGNYARKN